jgi:16S rRNA (uracil1498-N3)-methyltransferase
VVLSTDEAKHATKALRLRVGDECELFDGLGHIARSRISHVDARGGATVDAEVPAYIPWTGARWTVAVAVSGIGNRADWVVEKCAELGVQMFVPLLTERCTSKQRRGGEEAAEHARWVRLSAAASKQSLRVHSMCIAASTRLEDLLQSEVGQRPTLVALQGGGPLRTALERDELRDGGLLVVGPPGDFTDAEKHSMAQAGAVSVGLGELRLRTETAAVALTAAACLLI